MQKSALRIRFVILIISLCANSVLSHPHKAPKSHDHRNQKTTSPTVLSGGYQYVPGMLQLPKDVNLKHAHGLARDKQDNIYLAYESNEIDANTHAIAVFNREGQFVRYIGDQTLAEGSPHGLDLVYEGDKKILYLSNNGQTVRKIDMQGQILWEAAKSPTHEIYQQGAYKPTDTAVGPDNKTVFVADGYGSSTISARKSADGLYMGNLWQGGKLEGKMKTPHGVTFDSRVKRLAVSDRGNARVLYYSLDGTFHSQVTGQGISEVCNTDVWQQYLLVPNLDGSVVYLDKNNTLAGTIELDRWLGEAGHKHPHDAIFMSNGDIVIATWNPGRLSYWKRTAKAN
jgi:DNA-binding beta-propeller fold protein YncE